MSLDKPVFILTYKDPKGDLLWNIFSNEIEANKAGLLMTYEQNGNTTNAHKYLEALTYLESLQNVSDPDQNLDYDKDLLLEYYDIYETSIVDDTWESFESNLIYSKIFYDVMSEQLKVERDLIEKSENLERSKLLIDLQIKNSRSIIDECDEVLGKRQKVCED